MDQPPRGFSKDAVMESRVETDNSAVRGGIAKKRIEKAKKGNKEPFPFFGLLGEIRNRVYELLIPAGDMVALPTVCWRTDIDPAMLSKMHYREIFVLYYEFKTTKIQTWNPTYGQIMTTKQQLLTLFLVSKKMMVEACYIFHNRIRFLIHHCEVIGPLCKSLGPHANMLKTLHIELLSSWTRDPNEATVIENFSHLLAAKSLRHVDIRFFMEYHKNTPSDQINPHLRVLEKGIRVLKHHVDISVTHCFHTRIARRLSPEEDALCRVPHSWPEENWQLWGPPIMRAPMKCILVARVIQIEKRSTWFCRKGATEWKLISSGLELVRPYR